MNALTKVLNEESQQVTECSDEDNLPLEDAAEKWAMASCQCYSGDLLRKALEISVSIVTFVDELRKQNLLR